MNRRNLLVSLVVIPVCGARPAWAAAVVRESRAVAPFTAVDAAGVGEIVLRQGAHVGLAVEAEAAVLPHVRHAVRDGTLRIWLEGAVQTQEPLRYHVTMQAIRSVTLQGSVSLRASPIDARRFDLRLDGSGNADIERLDAEQVGIVLSGAGAVHVMGGATQSQRLVLDGAGDYRADRMTSRTSHVDLSGSGSVTIAASERLEVAISGSGDIAYRGRPAVQENISGSGSVSRLD